MLGRLSGEPNVTLEEAPATMLKHQADAQRDALLWGADASIIEDFSSDSPALLLAFAGLHQRFGMPVFEFDRITSRLPVKRLLMRDLTQSKYQQGVPGVGTGVGEVAAYLKRRIDATGCRRVVAVGGSAGGFAALLFGHLLEVEEVHAFSPQTFIDTENRARYGDDRSEAIHANVNRDCAQDRQYFDLANVFAANQVGTAFHVHYGNRHLLDTIHAKRMESFANIQLHEYDYDGHSVVRKLKEDGMLEAILRSAIGPGLESYRLGSPLSVDPTPRATTLPPDRGWRLRHLFRIFR